MTYALVIGAAVSLGTAAMQADAAETGAFWAGQGGGGGMFQGDFNVNLGGSGMAYQSTRSGEQSAIALDPVLVMAAALGVAGLIIWSKSK